MAKLNMTFALNRVVFSAPSISNKIQGIIEREREKKENNNTFILSIDSF